MSEICEHCNCQAAHIMTTFNYKHIDFWRFVLSLSSIIGCTREIFGGNNYLGKYLQERMSLFE